jgi:hypothetical protein
MLSSISPLGERARNSRWWLTTAAYLLGSLAGGLTLGGLAGLVGALVPVPWRTAPATLVACAVGLVVGVVLDLRARGDAVPSWRRQVDVGWLEEYRGWVMGLGFGAQLGFGLVTIVSSTTTYAAVLLAALTGQAGAGLVVGATFGLVRALPSVLMAGIRDRESLHRVFDRLERWAVPARFAAMVALSGAAVALGASAMGS